MIDHTKQGSTQALKDSLKRLNSDWARLKNKVAIRQHTLKQTMAELEQFNMALQRDQHLMTESDKFAEECYDYLDDSEDVLEQRLRVRAKLSCQRLDRVGKKCTEAWYVGNMGCISFTLL